MGLDNRDYVRNRSGDNWTPGGNWNRRSGGGRFADWEVWKKIIAVNVAVFLLQVLITRPATEADFEQSPFFDEIAWQMEMDDEFGETDWDQAEFENTSDGSSVSPDEAGNEGGDEAGSSESKADQEQSRAEKLAKLRQQYMRQQLRGAPRVSLVQEWLELDSEKIKQGQIWRLLTCAFCHDKNGIWHLGFNMLFLYWFGRRLEARFGSREFSAFYIAAALAASFAYLLLDIYTGDHRHAIGASGAVFGVTAVYALLFPYEKIYVYMLFPVEIRFLVALYFIYDLHPVLLALSGEHLYSGVGHAAHVGGAIFGFLYWYNRWQLMPMVSQASAKVHSWLSPQPNVSSGTKKPTIRRPPEEPSTISMVPQGSDDKQDNQQKLDKLLDKISRDGHDSLSDDELLELENLSRKMREDRGK